MIEKKEKFMLLGYDYYPNGAHSGQKMLHSYKEMAEYICSNGYDKVITDRFDSAVVRTIGTIVYDVDENVIDRVTLLTEIVKVLYPTTTVKEVKDNG